MLVLLLTASNITNLLLCLVLLYLFIFRTGKDQKSIIVVCLVMGVVFLTQVSPQNNKYIINLYERLSRDIPAEKPVYLNTTPITAIPDSLLDRDHQKQKIAQLYLDSLNSVVAKNEKKTAPEPALKFIEKPVIPKDSIHTPSFQHKKDTTTVEKNLLRFIDLQRSAATAGPIAQPSIHIPGKLLALQQTFQYFKQHPLKIFTGLGMGNFSSKLAFRTTAMKIAGGYPQKYSYISNAFKTNHLDLYIFYFTKFDDLHSIANSPNSTYDQLVSEYGLAGILAFVFLYVGFFLRKLDKKSYALPLMFVMMGSFFADYWFEQLSVVVLFELFLFLDIKEKAEKQKHAVS